MDLSPTPPSSWRSWRRLLQSDASGCTPTSSLTEEERDEGVKLPTAAHRAVATLAACRSVRIILTTNFDRLMEQALDTASVPYDVWPSPDAISGGRPLSHGQVVVKLHGDYRDTRLRNTTGELDAYEPAVDRLLDQALDEVRLGLHDMARVPAYGSRPVTPP